MIVSESQRVSTFASTFIGRIGGETSSPKKEQKQWLLLFVENPRVSKFWKLQTDLIVDPTPTLKGTHDLLLKPVDTDLLSAPIP